jgi:hypothetical protein
MTVGAPRLRLADRDRRALRLGLRLSAPVLLYAFAVKPYVASVRAIDSQLQTQSELLTRERALVADAPSIPRLIAAARVVACSTAQRIYAEQDPIAATSALSRDVARAFDAAGVTLQRVETHDSRLRPDGLRELAIDVRGEGDFRGVLKAIASLEGRGRLVRMTRIAIESGAAAVVPGGASDASVPPNLTMVATVHGYAP